MPFITVNRGRTADDIQDGVYVVTLTSISDPRTVTARQGPKAGQEIDLLDWTFATEAGAEIEASTSTASGPKSKLYAYLTALFGGKAPPIGLELEKDQLIGRQALATVQADENGWPRLTNLSALPNTMSLPQAASQPAPAPVVPTNAQAVVPTAQQPARPAGAPVTQQGSNLPF